MATCFATQLARKWQPFLHITPSAVLVLVWNYLMYSYYILLSRFANGIFDEVAPATWYKYGFVIIFFFGYFFFPFLGLLADVWIGRYKAILIGIVLCFISWIMMGIGFIVDNYFTFKAVLWSFFSFGYTVHFCGYSSFTANIIQYNIDQLLELQLMNLVQSYTGIYYLNHLFYSFFTFFNAYFISNAVALLSRIDLD